MAHVAPFYVGSKMAFCVHMYIISHVTYEDFLPYIEKWYTPKIPHNSLIRLFMQKPEFLAICLSLMYENIILK